MRFFQLLHRRTKSENDVANLLSESCSAGVTAPVFVPLPASLPLSNPTCDLYASPTNSVDQQFAAKLNSRIIELEARLTHLQDEHVSLKQDLFDYRTDLLQTRTELYSEMLRSSRHQQQVMDDFRTIQKLEARHQGFCTMLVDIGIPRSTVDVICQAIHSGSGSADDILVGAIMDASNDRTTLLARPRPITTEERTPEHYQSALNMTLSIRKELKSQKKKSKFWKKLAQEDDRHLDTVTPSPSDISSIREDLPPARQCALDALIARRHANKYSENTDGDVFGGQKRVSVLDSLASSLASHPRLSVPDDLKLFPSFSSSASSTSTTHHSYFSDVPRIPGDSASETPTVASRLPSTLNTSLRRSSRSSTQSLVLGSINLNVSRSSSIDPTLEDGPDAGPTYRVTLSQDLPQNSKRVSQEQGHRRTTSTTSRRSVPARSSFRLSAFSPIRACNSHTSENAITGALFHTPDIMQRLSELALATGSDTDTPASSKVMGSEGTPFNDAALPRYGANTPVSPTDLEWPVATASTPSDAFAETSLSMTISTSTSISTSEASAHVHHEHRHDHVHGHTQTEDMIPPGESNDSLFSTSTSASATSASTSLTANDTSSPTTPPTPCPVPVPVSVSAPGLDTPPRSSYGTGITPSLSKRFISPTGSGPGSGSTSASSGSVRRSMLPVLAKHLRRLSLSGSPNRRSRERLVGRLRGLGSSSRSSARSLSRSRSSVGAGMGLGIGVWRSSPACSESSGSAGLTVSPSSSPVKGSGIPVLQRRMTIRARRMTVRKA